MEREKASRANQEFQQDREENNLEQIRKRRAEELERLKKN